MNLVVATRSQHKMREIREILAGIPGLELFDLEEAGVAYTAEEEDLEPFETFEENASSKARYFRSKTGLPTVADDSGLEVEALAGAPGVRTKRFAPGTDLEGEARDRANNAHLLKSLDGVSREKRRARYVCVAALAWSEEKVETFRGEAPGIVMDSPRGGRGFGYDPIIEDEASGKSFAELTPDEKNARSHRGRAFRAMGAALTATSGDEQKTQGRRKGAE
jgi:XTP/dITP diphosphohydrolase